MKYVLDASVAVRWKLLTPLSPKARRLRAAFQNQIHELIAPETIIWETSNALIKAERQKLIPAGDAKRFYYDFLTTHPALHGVRPLVLRAMDIALQTRAGLYDCLYVVLAEREQCELVTADDKLVRNLQGRFPFIVPLASLP
jgi:predicted nucleic acid-binding protein